MNKQKTQTLFPLLRCAICGAKLTEEERNSFSPELLSELLALAEKHDLGHLLAYSLKQNGLIPEGNKEIETGIFKAVFRYERLNYEYERLCAALEEAKIPFLPLKGSFLRKYYPEPWMRTSCDIDILVHREDLERAIAYLTENLQYVETERATHDVSLYSPQNVHLELHFDLVEEGRAKNATDVLSSVWENLSLREGSAYFYEMSDAFFYFYHIAHMAKHFETGGCGIRPFLDLWILDGIEGADKAARDALLEQGGLLQFAEAARRLSEVWFGACEHDGLTEQMQAFLLHGGVYGSTDNRVALNQRKQGGRLGYFFSRLFVTRERLQRYYPVLKKHPWLMPAMQVRRWFMLLKPDVAAMAKSEMRSNANLEKSKADAMNDLLNKIGL